MNATIPEHIRELARKYLSGTITPEEKVIFDAWYQEQPAEELVWDDPSIPSEAVLQQTIFHHIETHKAGRASAPLVKQMRPVAAAAAVLALVLGTFWWQHNNRQQATGGAVTAPLAKNDKAPGKSGAILVLGDGRQVSLDAAAAGKLAEQGTTSIENNKGKLVYSSDKPAQTVAMKNTMITPPGRQYQLVLPDGTAVWLNAASELQFPTAFTGNSREVELKGEAYFEVAAGRTPFMVKANGTVVQVLGTHFNVNAYADEAGVNTALLQGAVKVVKGTQERLLKPGQQATTPVNSETITVSHADTEAITAWMGGEFIFHQTDIKTVMRQIARWYDMEVEYRGNMSGITISGNISRTVYASSLLKALELTKTIKCKIEGQRIIVMPNS